MKPVPGMVVKSIGVSGKPLPALMSVAKVHSFRSAPRQPVSNVPPPIPIPVVYCNCRLKAMALIEDGRASFRSQTHPVLRDLNALQPGRHSLPGESCNTLTGGGRTLAAERAIVVE